MLEVYVVSYINVDDTQNSEILGVYYTKSKAVDNLLKFAGYRESRDGNLTQYMEPSSDYKSYSFLREKLINDMYLEDVDIYRIVKMCVE